MKERLNYKKVSPGVGEAMSVLGEYIKKSGLEAPLLEIIKIRASQMNGCAQCLDIHFRDARALGQSEEKLNLIAAWREASIFTERERAGLEWTEAITRLDIGRVSDEVYTSVSKHFTEKELVDLTLAIVSINGYNRLNVAFRTIVAGRQPSAL